MKFIGFLILISCFSGKVNARYMASLNSRRNWDKSVFNNCYTENIHPFEDFATKTAYKINYEKPLHMYKLKGCTPVQFWTIIRHGTRFPNANLTVSLKELEKVHAEVVRKYDKDLSHLGWCSKDFQLFKEWQWDKTLDEGKAHELSPQGVEEMKYLARSFATRFGELLGQPYSKDVFYFKHSNTSRNRKSFEAYAEGLFGAEASQVHAEDSEDILLRPTSFCKTWIQEVRDNPETLREKFNFKETPEYRKMITDVSTKLGYNYPLNESVVGLMYDMCRYERAWSVDKLLAWCVIFTDEQLQLLAYVEDLRYYYSYGYGNKLNAKVGCPLLKDLYEKFEKRVNGDKSGYKVIVYTANSDTIQTFFTAMNIAKDSEPLTATNYCQQRNRKWRTSKIGTFGSNLVAVLNECQSNETYRVTFFLNEVPVNFPGCFDGVCNWDIVKNLMQDAAKNCNFDFCFEKTSR